MDAASLALFAGALVAACTAKPSADECSKLGAHYMELVKKDLPPDPDMAKDIEETAKGKMQAIETDCPKLNTKEQVACGTKAQDLDAFDACMGDKAPAKAPE